MGFEPTIFPVTGGRVNRATPRLHLPVRGVEPLSKAYESFVLPLNYTGAIIILKIGWIVGAEKRREDKKQNNKGNDNYHRRYNQSPEKIFSCFFSRLINRLNLFLQLLDFFQNLLFHVAGAGIAPAPGDYEPPDLLLVYPAVPKIISVL